MLFIVIALVDDCLHLLNWFQSHILVGAPLILAISCIVTLPRTSMSIVSFLAQLDFRILCLSNAFL